MSPRNRIDGLRINHGSDQEKTEQIKEIVRTLKLIPVEWRALEELTPACLYKSRDDKDSEFDVLVGDAVDLADPLPHYDIEEILREEGCSWVSAYHIEAGGMQALTVDADYLSRFDGVSGIDDIQGYSAFLGYEEIFIGGPHSYLDDVPIGLVGLVRQIGSVVRICQETDRDPEIAINASAFMVNSIQTGLPMRFDEALHLADSSFGNY